MAVVIGKTIFLHGTSRENFLSDKAWLRHELKHIAQYQHYGLIGFLLRYLYESMKHGYRDNKFEVEARQAETENTL